MDNNELEAQRKADLEELATMIIEKLEPVINKPEPEKDKAARREEILSIKDKEQRRAAMRENWSLFNETE